MDQNPQKGALNNFQIPGPKYVKTRHFEMFRFIPKFPSSSAKSHIPPKKLFELISKFKWQMIPRQRH